MQFEVPKTAMLKAISNVFGSVERRNTIPVLQNIKIEARNDRVTLFATDMDILVTSTFNCDLKKEGQTTIPAQAFFDIIRKAPEDTKIIISQDDEKKQSLQIKYLKSKYNLPCIEASEFPNLSEGEFDKEFTIESEKLIKMIEKTRFAISNDETRYYLNGLYLHSIKKGETFQLGSVATDGHRLALSFADCDSIKENFGVILPRKSVAEIKRVIEGSKKVTVFVSQIKMKIQGDGITIISKLIDGQFPDYNKVFPKDNDITVIVDKKSFYDCIDRASTIANDKHKSIKITLDQNKVNMEVANNDGSFSYEEMEINYSGNKIDSGFNSRYLMEVISQVEKDELIMKFKDGSSPVTIEAKDLNSVYIVMPIRI